MQFIRFIDPFTAECPGPGQAQAGNLCVYEFEFGFSGNRVFGGIFDPTDGVSGASMWGFNIYFSVSSPGEAWSYGEWTVAAP